MYTVFPLKVALEKRRVTLNDNDACTMNVIVNEAR